MLKKTINYIDFNGNPASDIFYFNLSKSELVDMELSSGTAETFGEMIQRIVETTDKQAIIATYKKIVLSSYGEKSSDGKSFVKTPELAAAFAQTAAYDQLFIELATTAETLAAFIKGIMPADMNVEAPTKDTQEQINDALAANGLPGLQLPPPMQQPESV